MRQPPLYDDVHAWLTKSARSLGVEGGCFHLKSRAGDRIVCQAITDTYAASHLAYSLDLSQCGAIRQVLEEGALLSVDDAEADSRVAPIAVRRFGLKSLLYCPVRLEQTPNAVAIFSHRSQRNWADDEKRKALDLVAELESILSKTSLGPSGLSSYYENMLRAVPGLVAVVDHDLLTIATSDGLRLSENQFVSGAPVNVDELLRQSDRGHELRAALQDISGGERDAFQGLFRTVRQTWWVHARRDPSASPEDAKAKAVVHVQPMPAAPAAVLFEEERNRLEALGRIAGSVAHEVNNALQHIALAVDGLEDDGSEGGEDRAVIKSAAERAARVTKKLLTFARRGPLELERRELTELIHDEMGLARRSVGADHHVSLRLRGRAPVRVDVRRLELVIINLCRNAAEVSPRGSEIVLEAGAEKIGQEEYGVLAVIDQGPGLPAEVVQNLGELQSSSKAPGVGTGLGLAVVHHVAREHGGEVVISAGPAGFGARVAIHLPLLDVEHVPSKASRSRQGPRVLVVDDEVEVVRMLARTLESKGYRTQRCWSLDMAKKTFDANHAWPDLVIFDINLGDGSGIELLGHIREARPNLPCLAISGLVDFASSPELVEAECRVLAKPFSREEFCSAVQSALPRE